MSKYIKSRIPIDAYEITFSYKTKKGNSKTTTVTVQNISEDLAKQDFWIWFDIMKGDKPQFVMKEPVIDKIVKIYTTSLWLEKKV